jgi:hypothetical protein
METVRTGYGILNGVTIIDRYPHGEPSLISIKMANVLSTPYGDFMPQYCPWADGRRTESVLSLYENGMVKAVVFQSPTMLRTPEGIICCESVTFHDTGALKRVFPLYGKLTGYWSESKEYGIARPVTLFLEHGKVNAKIISLAFYASGALRSITLWPKEIIVLRTPVGNTPIRTGVSFYEDGQMRSFEPLRPLRVTTPIGKMLAFDPAPTGICGDANSLMFSESGRILALTTVSNRITVTSPLGEKIVFEPGVKPGMCSDLTTETVPLRITFSDRYISIISEEMFTYGQPEHLFAVSELEDDGTDLRREDDCMAMADCCG